MAGINCPGVGDGLTRNGSYFNPALDWTRSLWVRIGTLPVGVGFTNWVFWSGTYLNPYLWEGGLLDQNMYIGVDGAASLFVPTSPGSTPIQLATWVYYTGRYTAATHAFEFFTNGVLSASGTIDLSGVLVPQPTELLGTDGASEADIAVAYERIWQAALTPTEILLERSSDVALRDTDLLASVGLTSITDLADESGNGHDWTLLGSPATYAGAGPIPLTPNAVLCATLTCNIPSCLPLTD